MARMFNPPHLGEVLREYLPDGMTIEEVAQRLGVSRVQLSRVSTAAPPYRQTWRFGSIPAFAMLAKGRIWPVQRARTPAWSSSATTVSPFRRAA